MSPLPGYQVFPDGWSAHHRPVAAATMTATCDLADPAAGPAPFPPDPDWTGLITLATGIPCRVQELNSSHGAAPVEQPTRTRQYLVTLPVDQAPELSAGERGTIITVTASTDPHLQGRHLRVIDVMHGSEVWERDVVCVENLTQNNP